MAVFGQGTHIALFVVLNEKTIMPATGMMVSGQYKSTLLICLYPYFSIKKVVLGNELLVVMVIDCRQLVWHSYYYH